MDSHEFFVGGQEKRDAAENEKRTGCAPALIVDMKAAIRYMRYNAGVVPGDVEKIITNGTSAGGALSALAGATGNAKEYEPYLKEIGAATARDDIFAASCYCPIHNLEHADAAYEWLFQKETTYHRMNFEMTPEGPKMTPIVGKLDEEQQELSKELKAAFPAYVNSLALKDESGNELILIRMINPVPFIQDENCDIAKNWRIRHGAFDRDTSIAIPVILATLLKNKGYQVDFALPWGLPHSGDYDLDELFAWIDELAK